MPGAIVGKGGTGGAGTFAQLAGDPNDNAALVAFVTSRVAAAFGSSSTMLPGVVGGGSGINVETGDAISGGTGINTETGDVIAGGTGTID